jgi:phage terminase large subunit
LNKGARIVCVREIQRTLKESVKRLIEDKILAFGLEGQFRAITDSIIAPGEGVILFQGMADHTAESIKSLEGFDIAYVEEAQMLTARSLEMLRPTIRKPGSELWFSWNPRHASDPVDELLRGPTPPPNSVVVRTNWKDNPFFPPDLEIEREYDQANNPMRYGHIWEGEYEPQAVGAIFDRLTIHRNRRAVAPPLTRILIA